MTSFLDGGLYWVWLGSDRCDSNFGRNGMAEVREMVGFYRFSEDVTQESERGS